MGSRETEAPHAFSLNRRVFLGTGAASLVALGVACNEGAPDAGAAGTAAEGRPYPFELEELSIDELQSGMASGRWTSRAITRLYLDRIAALDRQGPTLRAVIETNPDALAIADALDAERRDGSLRGPLHGIPILLKDNIATADRMTTTAGSLALEGSIPASDSHVARKLREAGAVLLGKANLSEWANIRSNRSSSGWSGRGGQCRNPYVLDRNPCGSSSGSGVAVSANLVAAAIGTETNGSIVCPSSSNGIVGVKPTVGLVSRSRIIPISHTQDTAGPMTRTVRDAAILLGALAGMDAEDPATAASEGHVPADYTRGLDANGLQGTRIGVARQFFGFHPDVDALMEAAIRALQERGAVIVDPVEFRNRGEMGAASFQVLLYELHADLDAYLAALGPGAPVKSLADVIAFNDANRDREMPWFGQENFVEAQEKGPLTTPEYLEAKANAKRIAGPENIDRIVADHQLDAILAPTGGPAWTTDLVNGDHFGGGSSSPAAIAGYPNISVPAGDVHGLPVGISFFGPAWSEPALLRVAYAFEQATTHRTPPGFLPSIDLG
ncbi:MAG: amidase [Gemmatimonadota bacterium]|jgi:amidase